MERCCCVCEERSVVGMIEPQVEVWVVQARPVPIDQRDLWFVTSTNLPSTILSGAPSSVVIPNAQLRGGQWYYESETNLVSMVCGKLQLFVDTPPIPPGQTPSVMEWSGQITAELAETFWGDSVTPFERVTPSGTIFDDATTLPVGMAIISLDFDGTLLTISLCATFSSTTSPSPGYYTIRVPSFTVMATDPIVPSITSVP